ncbi:MAG: RluA family pseudouridine synthase [Muribaculaceae bacterium]|nr:RluA family pseudouridine synthase [Muribaculaceae bacterium]
MAHRRDDRRRGFQEDRVYAWQNTGETSEPLMEFVMASRRDTKRNDVKRWLKYGHLMINGVVTTAFDAPVEPGQWVELNVARPFVVLKHPRLQLVYEDDDVIVVNKGYGLLSVSTESHRKEESAFSILRDYIKRQHPKNKLYVVHRLDRDTSGLMMFTKTEEAQEALRHNWNNMVLERTYVALLEGALRQDSGYVKSRLAENSQFVVYSTEEPNEGKLAVTHYKVLKRANGFTLAECSLDTGRKNEIRVHCKDLGHPIVGDRKYGAKHSPINRLALHARTLRFAHPITRQDMRFETPVPSRFLNLVKTGGKSADQTASKEND